MMFCPGLLPFFRRSSFSLNSFFSSLRPAKKGGVSPGPGLKLISGRFFTINIPSLQSLLMHFVVSQPADQANAKPWLLVGKRKSSISTAAFNAVCIARMHSTKSSGKPLAYLPFAALVAHLPLVFRIMTDTYHIVMCVSRYCTQKTHFMFFGRAVLRSLASPGLGVSRVAIVA